MLDGQVSYSLEVRNGCYSKYPEDGKYLALAEYLKRDPDRTNWAKLRRQLIARIRARVKHKRYQYKLSDEG